MTADLSVIVRGLLRERGFAVAAIVMLTLAIALNTTVYTVMDAILFRGYPLVRRGDRVVFLQERGPGNQCCISYPDFEDWRAQATSFEGLALVRGVSITFRDGDGRPMDMRARRLSTNTLSLLGVTPALGRDFTADDARPGAPLVTLLNHRFWQRRFGGRVDVVGTTVHIDGLPATVIGVLPERFEFPYKIDGDLWLPLVHTPDLEQRGLTPGGFTVAGRLRDGVTLAAARTELETINRRLEAAYPDTNRGLVPTVATHADMNSGPDATTTWGSLYAAAWFVLFVACANLANLMLVRTVRRWREFTTRLALGGGVGRVVRLVVLECVVLSALAGVCAWGVTVWSVRTWDVVTASQYQVLDYSVHTGTAAYLVAITVLVAGLVSLAPAIKVGQLGVQGALVADARGATHGRGGKRLATGLVAMQMALATVLLGGAGVLWRSFVAIVGAETGVPDAERVLVGLARLPSDIYPTPDARRAYFTALDLRLAQVPGVDAVAVASTIPVRFAVLREVEIEGRPRLPMGEARVGFVAASPGYFSVLDLAASTGRTFATTDTDSALPVAVVNERFAATFWPGEDAVGRRLRTVSPQGETEWRTVVGIVRNVLQGDPLRQQFKPLVYVPFAQEPVAAPAHYFLVRASVPLDHLAGVVQAQLQRLDSDVGLERFGSLNASFAFDRDFMDAEHSELGKHAKVAPIFAGIALLLAGIGLAAVLAHAVSQRTREIGVRMAIGATARDIRRLVLHDGMRPVLAGLIAGLVASLAVNRLLQSQLVGVSAYDPPTLAISILLLGLVAALACQVPARRAIQVDPAVTLRHD
jgi:putative ABC transport system permease protein